MRPGLTPSTAFQKPEKPFRQAAIRYFLHGSGECDLHRRRDGHLHAATLHAHLEALCPSLVVEQLPGMVEKIVLREIEKIKRGE